MQKFIKQHILAIEIFITFCLLLVVCLNGLGNVTYHSDEGMWINQSLAYEAFINGNYKTSLWKESYSTLTTNPITEYMIGYFRHLGGYKDTDLNTMWKFPLIQKLNIGLDVEPKPGLLWWSRLPMALSMVVIGLSIFITLRLGVNSTAAYIFLILFITNNYFLLILRRAMSEAPLLALVTFALIIGVMATRSGKKLQNHPRKSFIIQFILFTVMGIIGGIAGEAKLNGLLVIYSGIILFELSVVATQKNIRYLILTSLYVVCSITIFGTIAYVSVNPYLYHEPLLHIKKQIQFRFDDWQSIAKIYPPDWRNLSYLQSRQIVSVRIFQDYASIRIFNTPFVNILLCLFGIYTLGYSSYRWLFNNKASYASAVVLIVGLILSVPSLFTPIDWDRYYVLPVFFSTIFIAVGAAEIIRFVYSYTKEKYMLWR